MNFSSDLSKLFQDISSSVTGVISSLSNSTEATPVDGDHLKLSLLATLSTGPRTAHELVEQIKLASAGRLVLKVDQVFPILEELIQEKLVTVSIQNELKTLVITKNGTKWIASHAEDVEPTVKSAANKSQSSHLMSKAQLAKSAIRFGQAIAAVSASTDSKSIAEASKLVDKTTKKLFGMIAEVD